MSIVYVLYVSTSTNPELYPDLSLTITNVSYPLLYIGKTKSTSINNIIYDKRSSYTKSKAHRRYYRDYMDIFKYIENNPSITLGIHSLQEGVSDADIKNVYTKWLINYRLIHGSSVIIHDPETKKLLLNFISHDYTRLYNTVHDRTLPVQERQVLSRRQYEIRHRNRLNEKSRRYYESHKEELKRKRNAKRAAARGGAESGGAADSDADTAHSEVPEDISPSPSPLP
jgi:hypothetical protein